MRLSQIATALLVSVMLLCLMKNSILYAVYGFNQQVFIELFCANKNRPELHCDGKCELSRMFSEKQKESANQILVQLQLENQYIPPAFTFEFPKTDTFSASDKVPALLRPDLYAFEFFIQNHRPPQAA